MDRSGPGGPRGPQPPLVDQERSGPPWTTLRHFPDAHPEYPMKISPYRILIPGKGVALAKIIGLVWALSEKATILLILILC